jgi:hypothetical protein
MTTTPPPKPDTVILPQPQLIGLNTVAVALGIRRWRIYELLRERSPRVMPGYFGKISGRHTWNAHELFASMYTSTMALADEIARVEAGVRADRWCSVPDCDQEVQFLDLCRLHLLRLQTTFTDAEGSGMAVYRLLAMCTWVVERNRHLTVPHDWDPWSGVCMVPACDNRTDETPSRSSPLCPDCSAKFWG